MNLVFNAVDALPAGGEIRLVAAQRGAHVEVAVSDDGEGMPAEVRARVFEPFFTTKGEGGTGLGLSQVFGIVEQHGGHVAVDSAAGRGTTVRLVFPRGLPARGDRARGVPARGSGLEGAPRALRILAVDDEPTLAGLLAHMLHRDGHAVAVAHSGEAALEVLDRGPFDLVVSDLGMGGISGWDLAEQVRARRPGLPFVLATGWGAEIDPDEARRRGVAAVLAKPYRLADLRRVVRDIDPATERPP
jgi:CheY-like chemotaxis protein